MSVLWFKLSHNSSTGAVKSDIFRPFHNLFDNDAQFFNNIQSKKTIRKREINEKSEQYFKEILREVNWKHLDALTDNNLVYEYFLCTYNGLYNHAFPIKEVS